MSNILDSLKKRFIQKKMEEGKHKPITNKKNINRIQVKLQPQKCDSVHAYNRKEEIERQVLRMIEKVNRQKLLDQVKVENVDSSKQQSCEIEVVCFNQTKTKIQNQPKIIYEAGSNFQCPCGKKEIGSYHLFQHIKDNHMNETLTDILRKSTLHKLIKKQKLDLNQFGILFQMDTLNYSEQVKQVSKYFPNKFIGKSILPVANIRGSCKDMANKFIVQISHSVHEGKMLVCFFEYLRKYIQIYIGIQFWQNQAPSILLRDSKSIILLYQIICKRYSIDCPLTRNDFVTLYYCLAKWMFDNQWTTDKVFKVQDYDETDEDEKSIKSELIRDDLEERVGKKRKKLHDKNYHSDSQCMQQYSMIN